MNAHACDSHANDDPVDIMRRAFIMRSSLFSDFEANRDMCVYLGAIKKIQYRKKIMQSHRRKYL